MEVDVGDLIRASPPAVVNVMSLTRPQQTKCDLSGKSLDTKRAKEFGVTAWRDCRRLQTICRLEMLRCR